MDREEKSSQLFRKLEEAIDILDESCDLIIELDIDRSENIRRVGRAMAWIFKIEHTIYDQYPHLEPDNRKSARTDNQS